MADVPSISRPRGIIRDGFIPRIFRAFKLSMSILDGHTFRSRQRKGRKEQYFRFDFEFNGSEPSLDDTTKIQELKATARAMRHGRVIHIQVGADTYRGWIVYW